MRLYLGDPSSNKNSSGKPLFLIPDQLCGCDSVLVRYSRVPVGPGHRLLGGRVYDLFSVMWVIDPPQDGKIYRPYGAQEMVCHKYVSKVKCSFGVFLLREI
jgi:hypothetical protein